MLLYITCSIYIVIWFLRRLIDISDCVASRLEEILLQFRFEIG
jgi:hypothetical protein